MVKSSQKTGYHIVLNLNPPMARGVDAAPPQQVFQVFLEKGKSFYSKQNF